MGRSLRPSPELVWQDAPEAFEFLVRDAGFMGPERVMYGVVYHRAQLSIEICYYDYNGQDPEIASSVAEAPSDEARRLRAPVERLYVACGLGVAQDVPGSAQTRRAALKSIALHAEAVRRLLPFLLSDRVGELLGEAAGPAGAPRARRP